MSCSPRWIDREQSWRVGQVLRWERRLDVHARFGKTVVRPLRYASANRIVAPGLHFGGSGIDGLRVLGLAVLHHRGEVRRQTDVLLPPVEPRDGSCRLCDCVSVQGFAVVRVCARVRVCACSRVCWSCASVRVSACVRACVRACVCVRALVCTCVCACMRECVRGCVRVCVCPCVSRSYTFAALSVHCRCCIVAFIDAQLRRF